MSLLPPSLTLYSESLCKAIRKSDIHQSKRILLYRGFILDHFRGVLECSFPRFTAAINPKLREQLIHSFLENHVSEHPEFHAIATEFVEFIQQRNLLPKVLLCLLEYEWLVYATEINMLEVSISSTGWGENYIDIVITANPTLQCIMLSFALDYPIDTCPIAYSQFYYAVFRNAQHQVVCKPLCTVEQYVISQILEYPRLSLKQLIHKIDANELQKIISQFNQMHLINIHQTEVLNDQASNQ